MTKMRPQAPQLGLLEEDERAQPVSKPEHEAMQHMVATIRRLYAELQILRETR